MNQHKNDYNNFSYYCQGRALFHNFKIDCFDGHAHGSEDFEHAFANSCNSAFSTMGDKLNLKKYIRLLMDYCLMKLFLLITLIQVIQTIAKRVVLS